MTPDLATRFVAHLDAQLKAAEAQVRKTFADADRRLRRTGRLYLGLLVFATVCMGIGAYALLVNGAYPWPLLWTLVVWGLYILITHRLMCVGFWQVSLVWSAHTVKLDPTKLGVNGLDAPSKEALAPVLDWCKRYCKGAWVHAPGMHWTIFRFHRSRDAHLFVEWWG